MSTVEAELVPVARQEVATRDEWSIDQIVAQTLKVQQCMAAVMKKDEHYGFIPGTQGRDGKPAKPTLLKPGAEKLCLLFRLCPEYETLRAVSSQELVAYTVRCVLTHIPTGNRVATGLGSCNSREAKYTRAAPKKCPKCEKEAIKRSKYPPRDRPKDEPGWYCHDKAGGCGANFAHNDAAIIGQVAGIADPSDLDNTILKVACKRALVAAVLNGTAASDCFTQDLEDLTEKAAEYAPPEKTYVKANKVPVAEGDPMAATAQIQRIHVLQTKIGLDDQTYRGTWLGPYKVTSSKDLTFDQAANLIKRMEAQAQRNEVRVEKMREELTEELGDLVNETPPDPIADAIDEALSQRQQGPADGVRAGVIPFPGTDLGIEGSDEDYANVRAQFKRVEWTTKYVRLWLADFLAIPHDDDAKVMVKRLSKDQCATVVTVLSALPTPIEGEPKVFPSSVRVYTALVAALQAKGKLRTP